MDERMLLLSLRRHGQLLSVAQLVTQWEPTWDESEIRTMLNRLETTGDVVREDGVTIRYCAASPVVAA